MTPLSTILPDILTQYHQIHDLKQVPILVDPLRQIIEGRGYADRIFVERFLYESKLVIARVEFYRGEMGVYAGVGNYARVQFSNALNVCWTRFAVIKEMYHCLLDSHPANRVTDISGLMKLGQMLVSDSYATIEDYPPHHTEEWAEILALETLFPIELRSYHKEAYDKGEISPFELALRYRIPEMYVRQGMLKGYYESIYNLRVDTFVNINS